MIPPNKKQIIFRFILNTPLEIGVLLWYICGMSKKGAKNGVKTLSLRLPQQIAKAVAKRAKEQKRSLNAQICFELHYLSPIGTTTLPNEPKYD